MIPDAVIYWNGRKVNLKEARIAFRDENEIAVFESLRSYSGKLFRAEEHLDRLFESAKSAGLRISKPRGVLIKELERAVSEHLPKDRFLRLTVNARDSYIFLTERVWPQAIYRKGVDLRTSAVRRNFTNALSPEIKSNAFLNGVLAKLDPPSRNVFETIFLDQDGYVVEAAIWNIFGVKNESLLTPQTGFLNGVTRRFVIECARLEHLSVLETNLTRHDFWSADEAFLTNTSGEIVPIRSLDGRKIGQAVPGRATNRLMNRFREEVKKELHLK